MQKNDKQVIPRQKKPYTSKQKCSTPVTGSNWSMNLPYIPSHPTSAPHNTAQKECSAGRSLNGNSESFLSAIEHARKANNALTNKDIRAGKQIWRTTLF